METLFVIGAGTMGGGIAQVAALNGFTVYLYDIKQEFVDKGLKASLAPGTSSWPGARCPPKTAMRPSPASSARWTCRMPPSDVVIEAAVEDLDVKRSIFSKLDGIVSPGCILATNTSSLSVTPWPPPWAAPTRWWACISSIPCPAWPSSRSSAAPPLPTRPTKPPSAFRTAGQNGGHRE